MAIPPIARRVLQLCEERDVSHRAASIGATGDPDTIRNMLRGKSKHPRIDTLQALATYFGVPVSFFYEDASKRPAARMLLPSRGVRIMGRIEKGVWFEADAKAIDGHLPIAADPRWPAERQEAYEIGDSEYVTVLRNPETYDASATLVIERTMITHGLVELSLARSDGQGGYIYEDGKPVPTLTGVKTRVLGMVLWRLTYHGP